MEIETVLRTMSQQPRFHGNGFVQLYLSETTRLHVYDPMLPRTPGHNAAIHSHTYDMSSTVLLGRLTHVTYAMSQSFDGTHELYTLSHDKRRSGAPDFDHVERIMIRETGRVHMVTRSSYTFARDELHDSMADILTATLWSKHEQSDDCPAPYIVAPRGETPTNAFDPDHRPSEERLWDSISRAMWCMDRSSRELVEGVALSGVNSR